MGLEYYGGRPYYYSKTRKGDKVHSTYEGGGELARMMADIFADAQAGKRGVRWARKEEQATHGPQDRELLRLEMVLNELFTRVALESGYHKPKRQWRKKRPYKTSGKPTGPASLN